MVHERGTVTLVIQDHPCHPLLHLIRFISMAEGIEVPIQVSVITILLIEIKEIPHQTLLHYLIL